jgi:hypothetical protein
LAAGFFDYTYGHSLGLILIAFAVLPPLIPASQSAAEPATPLAVFHDVSLAARTQESPGPPR